MNSYSGQITWLISVALTLLCTNMSSAAETNSQLISDEQIYSIASMQFEKMKKAVPTALDNVFAQRARCVAEALIAVTPDTPVGVKWEIRAFEDSEPNVFSLPGGQLGINSGIQSVAKNIDELATAIATPVAQVVLKHTQKMLNRGAQAELQNEVLQQLGVPSMKASFEQMEMVQQREDDLEADRFGRKLMSAAGFDVMASITLLEKLEANRPLLKSQLEPRLTAARAETQNNSPSASNADFKTKKHQCEN